MEISIRYIGDTVVEMQWRRNGDTVERVETQWRLEMVDG
jgi:hypothetical protein